ncbi:unnamed protein product, partial [Staurois parvus]
IALYHVTSVIIHRFHNVVSNDVRSDILLTTLYVITDWQISDHMIGTSYRGPVRRSVFHCVWKTQRAPDGGAAARAQARCGEAVYKQPPDPATATRPCSATVRPFIY